MRHLRFAFLVNALGFAVVAPAQSVLEGNLELRWGDAAPGTRVPSRFDVDLVDDAGQRVALDPAEALLAAGDLYSLAGRKVAVSTRPAPWIDARIAPEAMVESDPKAPAKDGGGAMTNAVTGTQAWVTLLCKFSDVATEPKALSYFDNMLANTSGRLDDYWREVSYGKANVAGSHAYGWFVLPQPRSYYVTTSNGHTTANLSQLFADCTAAANSQVNFANFVGVNTMYNGDLDGFAWGGNRYAALDGPSRNWYVTWEPPWGYANEAPLAHEMGHGFGLPHANNSDGDNDPYDNPWDVMSDAWDNAGGDATYGTQPKHINTYSRDRLGWIDAARKLTLNADGVTSNVTLDRASLIGSTHTQMIVVTLPSPEPATHYYIIEARKRSGYYEAHLAGDAVIVHEVNTTWPEPSHSITATSPAPTTANDAGSMFVVGESWTAPNNAFRLDVNGTTTDGFLVTVRRGNVADDTLFKNGFQ